MKRVLVMTKKGIYCPEGDFYIDPSSKVDRSIVTHAHSDHTRRGSKEYFCAKPGKDLVKYRIGNKPKINAVPYRKEISFNNVKVSFHPAGHILGSSQIRVESGREVWVVSGDYKRDHDPSCHAFEVVPCDVFITEATFAHPKYVWQDTSQVVNQITRWIEENKKNNIASILFSYSLGKSQRLLGELRNLKEKIYIHPLISPYVDCYRKQKIKLAETEEISFENASSVSAKIVIAPVQARQSDWMSIFDKYESAYVSGWAILGNLHGFDEAFVLSDHADWPALIKTIEETGAKKVYVTHGDEGTLVKYLLKKNIAAAPLSQPIVEKMQQSLVPFLSN